MWWNKALTFGVGSIKLKFRAIVLTQYMHAKMFSIQMLLYTFQSNYAEGLHFSTFHYFILDVLNFNDEVKSNNSCLVGSEANNRVALSLVVCIYIYIFFYEQKVGMLL